MSLRCLALAAICSAAAFGQSNIGRYEIFENSFAASGAYANPYVDLTAEATFTRPDGKTWRIPLFWDGDKTWKVRLSPDTLGKWTYRISSADPALGGRSGSFSCIESKHAGSIRASASRPGHFELQNGSPFWFTGDTAWAYFTDIAEEKHNRAKAEEYVKTRAAQGFNVIHSMLLSEGGDGNQNGPPWRAIAEEQINPDYFREVDSRIGFANNLGVTVGIALAWGDKQGKEPFAWRRFPSVAARKRYARYVAARFSAYNTYFLVSGEWHAEVRTRGGVTEDAIFREFVDIGGEFAAADPHDRMVGIHPMTGHGSVREFNAAPWMSFADYQQNYQRLHERVIAARAHSGPVVNSEYGYFLRDQNGDGKPDKANSYSADDMRFASWDIATAGGYLVTGFGTTYFGGRRDPGPFDIHAAKNRIWEQQIGFIKRFFEGLDWWALSPADEIISSSSPRGGDVRSDSSAGSRSGDLHPPTTTYWAMANPGQAYVVYVRGMKTPIALEPGARSRKFRIRQYNPRTGEFGPATESLIKNSYNFEPPDTADWLVLLEAVD